MSKTFQCLNCLQIFSAKQSLQDHHNKKKKCVKVIASENKNDLKELQEKLSEMELKLLELENSNKEFQNENETLQNEKDILQKENNDLKVKLEHKDEIIHILKEKSVSLIPLNSTTAPKLSPFNFRVEMQNAYDLDEFKELIKDPNINPSVRYVSDDKKVLVIKEMQKLLSMACSPNDAAKICATNKYLSNTLETILKKIPEIKRPFFCSNKRKEIIYYKSKDEWVLLDDETLKKIANSLHVKLQNTNNIRKNIDDLYKDYCFRNKNDYYEKHEGALYILFGTYSKNDCDIPKWRKAIASVCSKNSLKSDSDSEE